MDLEDVILVGVEIAGAKLLTDNLGSFKFRNFLKKEESGLRYQGDYFTLEKLQLISPYAHFCALPDFEIEEPTVNKYLTIPFYDAAIKLVNDLEYSDNDFDFCKKNYLANHTQNKSELVDFLSEQKYNIQQNDSRYYLGFRSFYFALRQNLSKINYEYLVGLNRIISPFYLTYKHKELFTPGLVFIDEK